MHWTKSQLSSKSKNCHRPNINSASRNGIKHKKVVYKTQGWNIKYTEEECILNEVAYFTTNIDLPESIQSNNDLLSHRIPLMMEITLFFLR